MPQLPPIHRPIYNLPRDDVELDDDDEERFVNKQHNTPRMIPGNESKAFKLLNLSIACMDLVCVRNPNISLIIILCNTPFYFI